MLGSTGTEWRASLWWLSVKVPVYGLPGGPRYGVVHTVLGKAGNYSNGSNQKLPWAVLNRKKARLAQYLAWWRRHDMIRSDDILKL